MFTKTNVFNNDCPVNNTDLRNSEQTRNNIIIINVDQVSVNHIIQDRDKTVSNLYDLQDKKLNLHTARVCVQTKHPL